MLTSGTCCCCALKFSQINAKSLTQEHPKPIDNEASAAETWTLEGIASPDHMPMRVERELTAGSDSVEQALLLKRKQNKATTDEGHRNADFFH